MKTTLFLVGLLCLFAVVNVHAADGEVPEEPPVTDGQANCIVDALRELEFELDGVGDLGGDASDTVGRLIEQRQRCEDILGDPPTAMQERLHEACRLAWSASVLYELNRLRGESQVVDGAITAVQECRAN